MKMKNRMSCHPVFLCLCRKIICDWYDYCSSSAVFATGRVPAIRKNIIDAHAMKKKVSNTDYIKANRKGSREAEIELYGHSINHHKIHKSKKLYNRKRMKADMKNLPFLFKLFIV